MSTFDKILYTIFSISFAVLFPKVFLMALLMALALLWLRTWQMTKEPANAVFLSGRLPNPKPDGFYRGDTGFKASWLGKKFSAENATGINVFKDKKGNQIEKYSFKTYTGKGLFDKNMLVLKIDYDVKGNPFWMRCVLDEVVEVAPNEYLGKMHIKIIPGFPFSVLFFEL